MTTPVLMYEICASANPEDIKSAAIRFITRFNRPPCLLRMSAKSRDAQFFPALQQELAVSTAAGINKFCGILWKLWPVDGSDFYTVLSCHDEQKKLDATKG